jgi:excinuclease ABC subunit C
MVKDDLKKYKLPNSPGVYLFVRYLPAGRQVLYIGKATSLKDRVKSYFSNDLMHTRGPRMVDMITTSDVVDFQITSSVLEALLLEAELIKKYKPKYNIKEKDDKSYNFVCITNPPAGGEPLITIERGRSLEFSKNEYKKIYGPFPSQDKLKIALNLIRKIFPFKTSKNPNSKIYTQMGLEAEGDILKSNIKNIELFFEGKKQSVLKNLKKEMLAFSKEKKFEEANEIKRQIYALEHINDIALISEHKTQTCPPSGSRRDTERDFRIEAYDISHNAGKNSIGVMTVLQNSEVNKSGYRKFILRDTKKNDDLGGLKEILNRRLKHAEWPYPNLIVIDGGRNQLNVAKKIAKNFEIVSVLKDDRHKPKEILGNEKIIKKFKKEILLANSEAHRFAISGHRHLERRSMLGV